MSNLALGEPQRGTLDSIGSIRVDAKRCRQLSGQRNDRQPGYRVKKFALRRESLHSRDFDNASEAS